MPEPTPADPFGEFASDCARCAGLCCTALPFTRSRDFAADKPAGRQCVHLEIGGHTGLACRIHDRLRATGWVGCTVFECFGAGQRVTSDLFGGRTWAQPDVAAPTQFAAFEAMRILAEVRYYCLVLAEHELDVELRSALHGLESDAEVMAQAPPDAFAEVARDLRARAAPLLRAASGQVRRRRPPSDRPRQARRGGRLVAGADLVGISLRDVDLSGLDLRGALLIGADLRGARLHLTDVLGADLRDTDVRGADLSTALFLTQPQANAARGDDATALPSRLRRPDHWAPFGDDTAGSTAPCAARGGTGSGSCPQ